MNLMDKEWKEFKISDIFRIELASGDNQADLLEEGKIPLVSSGMNNNGVCKYIKTGDRKSQIFKGNVITTDMFGKPFYHPYNFFAVSHGRVNILIPKFKMNKEIGIFFVKMIEKSTVGKYSYNRMCSRSRLENQLITLPVNANNELDFDFMEKYVKAKEEKMISKYTKYLESLGTVHTHTHTHTHTHGYSLKDIKWKFIELHKLFNIYTGGDLIINKIYKGNIPIISHSMQNNGVCAYTKEILNRKLFDCNNTISLADRGNFFATIQKEDFYIGTRVKALEFKNKEVSKFVLLFLSVQINKQSEKFNYGHNACDNINNLRIMIPINKSYEIDYDYMENYVKKIMKSQIEKYLKYKNSIM